MQNIGKMTENGKTSVKELNELLDSALKDFENLPSEGCETSVVKNVIKCNENPERYFMEQAKVLAERMNTMFCDSGTIEQKPFPHDMVAGIKKIADAAAASLQNESQSNEEAVMYSESISEALTSLRDGTENLAAPVSDNNLVGMFSGLNLDAKNGENNIFLPFMESMMQSLFSAEVLLPSIKELLEKYPKYLEQNVGKIASVDLDRYAKQLELYKVICGHLELESASDTSEQKREKFQIVLNDMRKLQDYGQPPEEILAENIEVPVFDPSLVANDPNNPQCPLM